MNNHPMNLRVSQERTTEGTRRNVTLTNLEDKDHDSVHIFFDLVGDYDAPEPQVLDGFVVGIIFYAMRLGQNIRVHGSLTREMMRNIYEFQDAWALWKPLDYRRVEIIPDKIVSIINNKEDEEAIAAFSGGIDSIFTALRHTKKLGDAAYPLKSSVLLVHGFDVALNKPEHLNALKERTAPLLKELGLQARVIRTNLKELNLQDWEDSHSSQLAACLHHLSHKFSYGLVGSGQPYNTLILPWGSTPVTDHLLSGGALRIIHDGAAYSRTKKIEQIAKNATAIKIAKVCWEGKETFKNCGKCEKCVRTLLSFLAVGVGAPSCFDAPLRLEQIKEINLRNDPLCGEFVSIVTYAKAKGLNAPWIHMLEGRIQEYKGSNIKKKALKLWRLIKKREWRLIANKIWHVICKLVAQKDV